MLELSLIRLLSPMAKSWLSISLEKTQLFYIDKGHYTSASAYMATHRGNASSSSIDNGYLSFICRLPRIDSVLLAAVDRATSGSIMVLAGSINRKWEEDLHLAL